MTNETIAFPSSAIKDTPASELRARELYNEYRRTKAAWDVVLYAPEHFNADVPDDINTSLSDAHSDALNQYLLHPATKPYELVRKMTVFRDEEIIDNWCRGPEIVSVLCEDAKRCRD